MALELVAVAVTAVGLGITIIKLFNDIFKGIGDMQKDLRNRIDTIFSDLDTKIDTIRERLVALEVQIKK